MRGSWRGSRCWAAVAARQESHIGQGHLGLDIFFVLVPVCRLIVVLCSEIRYRNKKEAAIAACFLVFGFWFLALGFEFLGAAEARVPFTGPRL